MHSGPPDDGAGPGLDRRQVRRAFGRAAASYDGADILQNEVRERLLERLQYLRLEPARILDLGAGTGRATEALRARFPGAEILALDLAPDMLRVARSRPGRAAPDAVLCGDAARLPLADGSVDLVFSNLAIHWCASLDAVFAEVRRVLRHPGAFCFSTLGPGSFRELREAWAAADGAPHVMDFPELRALGDGLLRAGLGEPVVDGDSFTIRYQSVAQLAGDLRATGTTNAARDRRRGLTGRRAWSRMAAAYAGMADAEGLLPATIQVIQGQAWAPDPGGRRGRPAAGEFEIPLDRLGGRSRS
jgi:malonyl-CoA O-methyltransferase